MLENLLDKKWVKGFETFFISFYQEDSLALLSISKGVDHTSLSYVLMTK
jgi:hypothetical protein